VSFRYAPKAESWNILRFNTGESSLVSDSNKGTERLRLGFVLKLDSGVHPLSAIGMAIDSHFRFSV
jgi:hypothetical protein